MKKKITATITPKDNNLKLETFLKTGLHLTKNEISRAKFRENGICINGQRRRIDARVKTGDLVEILLESGSETSKKLLGSAAALSVLYEDSDVIIMDKPAGISVHPAGKNDADTLANRLAHYLRDKGEDSVIRIFGRLDKDTSGAVLAVKNRAAATRLERQRGAHILFKTYLAVVEGRPIPPEGTINFPLAPDPKNGKQMRIAPEGKSAATRYETLPSQNIAEEKFSCSCRAPLSLCLQAETKQNHSRKTPAPQDNYTLVRLRLETGRTHQIRVHMAAIGCPLVGDPLYGNQTASKIRRTALHAHTIHFLQPFTGEEIQVTAPVPEDIRLLVPPDILC